MLRTLRKLLEPETAVPKTGGGKLTLREVLLRGWDELWYQPKIELRTKRLVGAEGLLRARRPDGSIVPPGDFLPGAKEEDMLALTERVILAALLDFEDCAVQGASVKLSVNVPVSALVKLPIARMLREHRPPTPNWLKAGPTPRRRTVSVVLPAMTKPTVAIGLAAFTPARPDMFTKRAVGVPVSES